MKKLIAAVFLFLFVYTCAAAAGGPSAALGAGRVEAVLPGRTSVFDLYEAGYSSGMLERKKENLISLVCRVTDTDMKYNIDKGGRAFVFDFMDEKNNYINCWLSDNDVIVVKPYYYYNGYEEFHSKNQYYWNRFFGIEVQYSTRVDKGLSAGAMVRYAGYSKEMPFFYSSPEGRTITAMLSWSSKVEFLVDASLKLSDTLTLAVSGGHKQSLLGDNDMLAGGDSQYAYFYNRSSASGFMSYRAYPELDVKDTFDARGINFNAGIAYKSKGVFEALLNIGTILDRSYTGVYTAESFYNSMIGTQFNADLKFRYYAGDNFICAMSVHGMLYDYTFHTSVPVPGLVEENGKKTDYQVLACAGISYNNDLISVPFELFLSSTPFDPLHALTEQKYAGVRGGLEYSLTKEITLRSGCVWPFLIEKNRNITEISAVEATFGAGFITGNMEIGLAAGYFLLHDISTVPQLSLDRRNWDIKLDIVIPL